MLNTIFLLASLSVGQIYLNPQGEAFPQTKVIDLPASKNNKIVLHSVRVEGDISNSSEPSLKIPFHVEQDLQIGIAKEFSIVKQQCNGTVQASFVEPNKVVLSVSHSICRCGSYLDFIGSLRYEIKYGIKDKEDQLIESGVFNLVQRNFLESIVDDPFSHMVGFNKETKILWLNSDYRDPESAQSFHKVLQIIGGHRYKIQFFYATPDSGSKRTRYNLHVSTNKYQPYFGWITYFDIGLEHSRQWKKFETVIKTPQLSSEMKVDMHILLKDTDKDFGEILFKNIIFVPLDGFKETGP